MGPVLSSRPLVLAHRGASGHLPEHTLAGYRLAARTGADYLEVDVVPTRDGVLVARHESELSGSTDIAGRPDLAAARSTSTVDGPEVAGWFTHDLDLAVVRTLRAREPMPALRPGSSTHDGIHPVPTLEEVLGLRSRLEQDLGRPVGVYVEPKHPGRFADLGLDPLPLLAGTLRRHGLDRPDAPVRVQSFDLAALRRLRHRLGMAVPLVWLLEADAEVPADLTGLAAHLHGIGPAKELVLPRTPDGRLGTPSSLVHDAHRAGLVVHPWTFRAENAFLPATLRRGRTAHGPGAGAQEMAAYLATGVDGVFTDHPGLGVQARLLTPTAQGAGS